MGGAEPPPELRRPTARSSLWASGMLFQHVVLFSAHHRLPQSQLLGASSPEKPRNFGRDWLAATRPMTRGAGCFRPCRCALLLRLASANGGRRRMNPCSLPHNSAHWPRYTPGLSTLNHESRMNPGIPSCSIGKKISQVAHGSSFAAFTRSHSCFRTAQPASEVSTTMRCQAYKPGELGII
jgi:hypothetical protein